jgi:hypothetical protein
VEGAVVDPKGRKWRIKSSPVRNASAQMVGVVEIRWPMAPVDEDHQA